MSPLIPRHHRPKDTSRFASVLALINRAGRLEQRKAALQCWLEAVELIRRDRDDHAESSTTPDVEFQFQEDETELWHLEKHLLELYELANSERNGFAPPDDRAVPTIDRSLALTDRADSVRKLFGEPDRLLATYGTLRPDCCNHWVVEEIAGKWWHGSVNGELGVWEGYPMLFLDVEELSSIPVMVLESEAIAEHIERIDRFEGNAYERIWTAVETKHGLRLASIYHRSEITG